MGVLILNRGQNPTVCWMHKVSSYRPIATKTLCSACRIISQASQIRSDPSVHTVDRKWSDRMDGWIRTGCCGNDVGVSLYIPWRSFPNREVRAGELTESHLAPQTNTLSSGRAEDSFQHDCPPTAVLCVVVHGVLLVAAWLLLGCFSADGLAWLWIWRCCSVIQKKTLWNLIWATKDSRLRHIESD